jgi:lipopolysaccharide transport system ATP-binding protein
MNDRTTRGIVEFERVSKRYHLGTLGTLRGAVSALLFRGNDSDDPRRVVWALRDVSFRVEPGGSLGLIGPNGAGKTTTLKLLSNITRPTAGRIAAHGRVSSLIELGAGFHPELTGRENIYLNGAILGLRRREIACKLDDIIAFSELERFIDTPVKRYSSGMYVRLGFAVAAHVEPDVLLVDEVLAVGDTSFRHRCIQHMRELRQKGTSIVFVSHNMHQVRDMCDSVLLLMNGQVRAEGEPSAVIAEYERLIRSGDLPERSQGEYEEPIAESRSNLILTAVEIVSSGQDVRKGLASHLPAKLRIHYQAIAPQQIGRVDIRIIRNDSTLCCAVDSIGTAKADLRLRQLSGSDIIEVTFDPLQLTTGTYIALVQVTDPGDSLIIASGQSRAFNVYGDYNIYEPGVYTPLVHWSRHALESE